MILAVLSLAQPIFCDVSPTESEIVAHASNQNTNNNEKQEIRKKLLLAKTRTARRSCWDKKGRTNAWWENFITNKVPKSERKDNFRMSQKSFFELCNMSRPYLEKIRTRLRTPRYIEAQVGSYLIILATKDVIEKLRILLEYLEHQFPELSEEYSMLSRHLEAQN